ncbi:serine aminopeptidase domain-containing protein [Kribbella deserti]|uniref:Serine aminopeptidase domain-containing protein n=1 Tax=Kribbella deserti TaxID=1926257 RepID=A0ABV6QTW8_9ACTN
MTAEQRYDALMDEVFSLYEQDRLTAALDILRTADRDLDPWQAELAHTEACLLGASDRPVEALEALRRAFAKGGWWHRRILAEDDDLAGLRDLPGFAEFVDQAEQRRADEGAVPGEHRLDVPAGTARGVLVALHGAGQRAEHARSDWSAALDLGYAVLAVESSQRMSPMYRTWPDQEIAAKDIAAAMDTVPDDLRAGPVVAAGFSAGGRAALLWALTADPLPVAGVAVLAPAIGGIELPPSRALEPAVAWFGAEDELAEYAEAIQGLPDFTVEIIPGLGHVFPADFGDKLAGVLGER